MDKFDYSAPYIEYADRARLFKEMADMAQTIVRLQARCERLEGENFALSANQCVDKGGIVSAENGDALCPRGEVVNQWMPIESAPEPCPGYPRLLLYVPSYGATTGHYCAGRWYCHSFLHNKELPTHWMSLPPPPSAGEIK